MMEDIHYLIGEIMEMTLIRTYIHLNEMREDFVMVGRLDRYTVVADKFLTLEGQFQIVFYDMAREAVAVPRVNYVPISLIHDVNLWREQMRAMAALECLYSAEYGYTFKLVTL